MPNTDRINSIYDVISIQREQQNVIAGLSASKKAILDLYESIQALKGSSFSTLAQNTDQLTAATLKANKATQAALDTAIKQEKLKQAQIQTQNEVIKQTLLEAQAQDKLAASTERANKIKTQTTTTSGSVAVIQPATSPQVTSTGSVSIQQPVVNTKAYEELNAQYKQAVINTKALAAAYGVQSAEAIAAAEAELLLKDQLAAINNVSKSVSQKNITQGLDFNLLTKDLAAARNEYNKLGETFGYDSKQALAAAEAVSVLTAKVNAAAPAIAKNTPLTINENTNPQAATINEGNSAATEEQLAAQRDLNVVTEDSVVINNAATASTQKFTAAISASVAILLDEEAALAINKAQQTELAAAIAAGGIATAEQNAQMVALRSQQFALNESIAQTRSETKFLTKDFLSEEGSILALRAQVNLLTNQYEALSAAEKQSQFGLNLKAQISTIQPDLLKAEGELGKFQRNVGNYSGGIVSGFKSIFSVVRQLAYILPGIGIAGIFSAAFTAVATLISSLNLFSKTTDVVKESIKGTSDEAKNLRDALRALGDNAEDIATGAFKDLEEANKRLRDGLGETPDSVEVAQGALKLLADQLDKLKEKYADLGSAASSGFAGVDVQADIAHQQRQIKEGIDSTNNLINKGHAVLSENRRDNIKKDLSEQNIANTLNLENTNKLQTDANNQIIANDAKSFGIRRAALADNLQKIFDLNRIEREKDLRAAGDNESKKNVALEKFRFENLKAQADYNNKLIELNKKAQEFSFGDQKAILQNEIDKNQKIISEENGLYIFRNEAAKKGFELNNQLINLELENRKMTAVQARIAVEKNEETLNENLKKILADRDKLQFRAEVNIPTPNEQNNAELKALNEAHEKGLLSEKEFQQQLAKLQTDIFNNLPVQQQTEQRLATAKAVQNELLRITEAAGQDRQNIIATDFANEETTLKDNYAKGIINREQYEQGLKDLAIKFGTESLKAEIKISESRLHLLDPMSDAYRALALAIAQAKDTLAGFSVDAKDNGLEKLGKDLQNVADVTQNLTAAITTINDISFNNQKAKLDELSAMQERNYQQEVNNINNSSLAAQDKADKLIIAEAKYNTQKIANDRKQREIDNAKARFDKAANIANIITATAAAVVKALPNIPLALAVGALGAAQLAAAIATKIPQYKSGLKIDKSGHIGMYGEAGYELVTKPNEPAFITNKPTIDYLPKGSRIKPLTGDMVDNIMNMQLIKGFAVVTQKEKGDESLAVQKQMLKALRKKPAIKNNVTVDMGKSLWKYINIYRG